MEIRKITVVTKAAAIMCDLLMNAAILSLIYN